MRHCYAFFLFLLLLPAVASAHSEYGSIEFIENRGQWKEGFLYKAPTNNGDVYLERNGFTFVMAAAENVSKIDAVKFERHAQEILHFHAYKVIFEGAKTDAKVTGSKPQQHYYNYFLGNDPTRWKSEIHPNLVVDYENIYNNIDLHIATENGRIKYDFIVKPGANPNTIVLKYEGADGLKIRNKNLQVLTSVGPVEEMEPYCYQYINGERKEVRCKYRIDGNKVSYDFPDGYDKTQTLVIDPTIIFATYTKSTADNFGFTATYDAQGNMYVGGTVNGTGYPNVNGHFQTTFRGGGNTDGNNYPTDMGISKFNPAGNTMLYSTYIGGTENDQPHSMVADANGNLVIAGRTYSTNFPLQNSYQGANGGSADIVVVKLNAAGTGLIGSTYVGGSGDDGVNISADFSVFNSTLKHSYADDARSEVILDNAGNVYVAASTTSSNFPKVNATQNAIAGAQDAVVFKLNPSLSNMLWSTYLGGTGDDAAYVLSLNLSQSHLYVAGGTESSNFPLGSAGLWGTYRGGITDGFIVKFENGGSYSKVRGTFIGAGDYDQCFGVQVDLDNAVYAMGNTLGGTFPVSAGVYSNANSSQFIIKLDSNLSSSVYSTVFGSGTSSSINISPVAFLVDTCQNVYISGWGGNLTGSGGSTNGMPVKLGNPPPPSILTGSTDGSDFYFFVLSKNGTGQLFGGFYGGSGVREHVDGGTSRFDRNGVIYQAICGGCPGNSNTPTTAGAYSQTNGSTNCNLVALKVAFNLGAVQAQAKANPDTTVCVGQPVQFGNGSANAVTYSWTFGDGGTSNQFQPTHVYNTPGTYKVLMVAYNPDACIVRDSVELTIIVDTNNIESLFDLVVTDSCDPYKITLTNQSKYGKTPANATFQWDFGDGTNSTATSPAGHTYTVGGTYDVRLIMTDPSACNSPDTAIKTVSFNSVNVKAAFQTGDVCQGDTVFLSNNSTDAQSYLWTLNDTITSNDITPRYVFDSVGTYKVKLVATNPASCNKADSVEKTFNVNPAPVANFTHAPIIPETNVPITFTNRSTGADLYNWNFGDNTGSSEMNPVHFYKRTGDYNVCLISSNKYGCSDTICRPVSADVLPLADIPTGFSPNGDGVNDVLYVRGAAIESVDLKIFNRWGELVFQTTDMAIGWDGSYKGKQQEMEAYAFVLNVIFIDGSTLHKKGNVTLLR